MDDELPFDESKIAAELTELGYDIAAAARTARSEYFARVSKWEGDIADGYLVPKYPVVLRHGNVYQVAIDCHTEHSRKEEVTVTLDATHIGNGEFRIECGKVVLLPTGNREVFISTVVRELRAFALDRYHGKR